MRRQQPLDGFNILLLFETGEDVQVVLCLDQRPSHITAQSAIPLLEGILWQRTLGSRYESTYSVSLILPSLFLRCSMTALINNRASERDRVGTPPNSPSRSSALASSSPPALTRAREVGAGSCEPIGRSPLESGREKSGSGSGCAQSFKRCAQRAKC